MRKPTLVAALLVTCVAPLWATAASAAPTELTVRIEGRAQTLFEGPILTDGHDVQAASDPTARPCDGTNSGSNPSPGPTPTAASVDAMAIVGEGFDGEWYPGYDDYFIQQWGPDREDFDAFAFWGVLVDGMFTSVGGCQFRATAGDEVLWAYDAFAKRPFLRLSAASDPSPAPGPADPLVSVDADDPLVLEVQSSTGAMDGEAQKIGPVAGVPIGLVETDPDSGFELVDLDDPLATTGLDGTATVSFSDPGWYRLKAASDGTYVRSNRLDVCVRAAGAEDCGPPPLDAQVRIPPEVPPQQPPPSPTGGTPQPAAKPEPAPAGTVTLGRVRGNGKAGSATLAIAVPGPGRISLSGRDVKRQSTLALAAGTVTLDIRAKGRALRRLREKGTSKVEVSVTFTAADATAATVGRRVVLKRAPG